MAVRKPTIKTGDEDIYRVLSKIKFYNSAPVDTGVSADRIVRKLTSAKIKVRKEVVNGKVIIKNVGGNSFNVNLS